jgi:hypothetical protein
MLIDTAVKGGRRVVNQKAVNVLKYKYLII